MRSALAGVVACALVLLPLSGSGLTASELAAVSVVLIALAAALAGVPSAVVLALRSALGPPAANDDRPPILRTRPTDPAHHPLAPRAPGLA